MIYFFFCLHFKLSLRLNLNEILILNYLWVISHHNLLRPSKVGKNLAHARTITTVPIDPIKIELTGPKKLAVTPDSNSPSSFDAPIKMAFTDETLPLMWSGVSNCINVILITTLRLSAAPETIRAIIERKKFVD